MPIDDEPNDLRTLWQSASQPTFRMSAEQLERKAAGMRRRLRIATVSLVALCVGEIATFTVFYFRYANPLRRVGSVLTVLGLAYLIFQLYRNYVTMRHIAQTTVTAPSVIYLRTALEHMREWSRGRWFWPRLIAIMPGPLLFSLGDALQHRHEGLGAYTLFFTFIGLGAIAILLNVVVAVRLIGRKLDRLQDYAREE